MYEEDRNETLDLEEDLTPHEHFERLFTYYFETLAPLSEAQKMAHDLLCYRLGLFGETAHTLAECAARFGISYERASQIAHYHQRKILRQVCTRRRPITRFDACIKDYFSS